MYDDKAVVEFTSSVYPTIENIWAVLIGEINGCLRKRHPSQPIEPQEASKWFMAILDRSTQSEGPQRVSTRNGEAYHYIWPYLSRCRAHVNMFLHATREHQDYILAAYDDGIRWRGENLDELRGVVNEFYEMRKIGVAEYRKQSIAKLKAYLSHTVTSKSA